MWKFSISLSNFQIKRPETVASQPAPNRTAKEYSAELRTVEQRAEEQELCDSLPLNEEQKLAFDIISRALDHCMHVPGPLPANLDNLFFVDGPAGTGKTHLYKKILHSVRKNGKIAVAVAMSGIAALLMPGGRTAHSRFRLPVPCPLDGCKCNVAAQSATAQILRDAVVIVWDEAPTASKSIVDAVDRCLRDLTGHDHPFGGKIVVFGGDFRQIPPVLRYVDRESVKSHTLVATEWWQSGRFKRLPLTRNMRADQDKPQHEPIFAAVDEVSCEFFGCV